MPEIPFPYLNLENIITEFRSIEMKTPGVDSYMMSYGAFIRYFGKHPDKPLTSDDLVIGIHLAYGWMPTIFEFKHAELGTAVSIINNVRRGKILASEELGHLKGLLNNSIVGASKLLHFINPVNYAIWDSRVYRFVTGNSNINHSKVNDVTLYMAYLEKIRELIKDEQFKTVIHQSMCGLLKEEISELRSLELVLFLGGPNKKTPLV